MRRQRQCRSRLWITDGAKVQIAVDLPCATLSIKR
jgi:hypothetical protein